MAKHKLPPWLRSKEKSQSVSVGVSWYTEEEWQKVKAAATDADLFEATYSEWVAMVEESIKNMLVAGIIAEKVPIRADELLAWCLAHGKNNEAASRAQFVSEMGAKGHGSGT
ncbi:hypothetical protein HLB44_36440 [Aquincola sp. S2]|uniref:Uncharacterized protein n=1 Tax=Pseudaquabacterium terrae TaxID=2732868 RepID=A0ABX2EUW3_9BURK|nr:hypothetical protein [Aquabacterium terrae]NRF72453.1 hypothetical protein [Aquabacterium terrae]